MSATRRPRPGNRRPPEGRNTTPLLIAGAVLAVVVVFGLVLAFSPGADEGDGSGGDALDVAPVSVEGAALPDFTDSGTDPAVGAAAPRLVGQAPDGSPTAVEPGRPTLLVFLAHWCPHCQAEVPVLVDMEAAGAFEDVRLVGVLTGTNQDAPNHPPAAWLEREGWPGEVLVDDATFSAGSAYGLTTYPYLVALDREGRVVARGSGEMPAADVAAMVALATSG